MYFHETRLNKLSEEIKYGTVRSLLRRERFVRESFEKNEVF